jgi:hypothetical protein
MLLLLAVVLVRVMEQTPGPVVVVRVVIVRVLGQKVQVVEVVPKLGHFSPEYTR